MKRITHLEGLSMSIRVHWMKTGKRGARAEFTDSDIITALLLISRESMGRYKLQGELALSESSTKSLLSYCKKKKFLESVAGRSGHSLTPHGHTILDAIQTILLEYDVCSCQPFEGKEHYYCVVRTDKKTNKFYSNESKKSLSSWKCRDFAISYGAASILLLRRDSQGSLVFPEPDLVLSNYFPNLEENIYDALKAPLQENDLLLLVAANSLAFARKSAIITAIAFDEPLLLQLRKLIS